MYRVLIVDDENIVRVALRTMIDWSQYNFVIAGTASNGAEALEFMKKDRVDLVVTDLKMPVINGIELIERLNGENYAGEIIILSNYDDFDLVRKGLVLGALDYILKFEISPESFLEVLKKAGSKLVRNGGSKGEEMEEGQESSGREELAWKEVLLGKTGGGSFGGLKKAQKIFLLTITIWDYQEKFAKAPERETALVHEGIANIIRDYLDGFQQLPIITMQEGTLAVVCRSEGKKQYEIRAAAEQISNLLYIYLNINASVIYSDWISDKSKLPELYRQAAAMSLQEACPQGPVVRQADIAPKDQKNDGYRKEIKEIMDYIDKNLDKKITLAMIAEQISINEAYMCTLFRNQVGCSIISYINERKMKMAAERMVESNLLLKDIAEEVGIMDQFYFNRLFKKHYEVTPSKYRKIHLKKEQGSHGENEGQRRKN